MMSVSDHDGSYSNLELVPGRVAHQIRNAVVTDVRRAVQSAVVVVEIVLVGILAANITAHRLAGVSNDEYERCSDAAMQRCKSRLC
jgi:hypothetical protein